jgi:hypothetical protein
MLRRVRDGFGVINAITRTAAATVESYDLASEFETFGGLVLRTPTQDSYMSAAKVTISSNA